MRMMQSLAAPLTLLLLTCGQGVLLSAADNGILAQNDEGVSRTFVFSQNNTAISKRNVLQIKKVETKKETKVYFYNCYFNPAWVENQCAPLGDQAGYSPRVCTTNFNLATEISSFKNQALSYGAGAVDMGVYVGLGLAPMVRGMPKSIPIAVLLAAGVATSLTTLVSYDTKFRAQAKNFDKKLPRVQRQYSDLFAKIANACADSIPKKELSNLVTNVDISLVVEDIHRILEPGFPPILKESSWTLQECQENKVRLWAKGKDASVLFTAFLDTNQQVSDLEVDELESTRQRSVRIYSSIEIPKVKPRVSEKTNVSSTLTDYYYAVTAAPLIDECQQTLKEKKRSSAASVPAVKRKETTGRANFSPSSQ